MNDESSDQPSRPRKRFAVTSVRGLMRIVLVCALVFGAITFVVHLAQESRPLRAICRHNLKQIAIALWNYHEDHGVLPPAVTTDANGRPMHSWRVLILPYLEMTTVYNAYNLKEPWDGPNNRQLIKEMPAVYRCPADEGRFGNGQTSYVAVIGPPTIFPSANRSISLDAIPDGTKDTILVVESSSRAIRWTEPHDLELARMSLRVNDMVLPSILGHEKYGFAQVAKADGSVVVLEQTTPSETLRAMLTIDGGETLPEPD